MHSDTRLGVQVDIDGPNDSGGDLRFEYHSQSLREDDEVSLRKSVGVRPTMNLLFDQTGKLSHRDQ